MFTSTIADHMETKNQQTEQENDLVRLSPLRWVCGTRTHSVSRWPSDFHIGKNTVIHDILQLVASNLDSTGLSHLQEASGSLWEFGEQERRRRNMPEEVTLWEQEDFDERYECYDTYDKWDQIYNDDHLDDWDCDDWDCDDREL